MNKNFQPDAIFERLKAVGKVRVNDKILTVKSTTVKSCAFPYTEDVDIVVFLDGKTHYHSKIKDLLYERWVLIDGVLHYIQKVNNWMGGADSINYINAEC